MNITIFERNDFVGGRSTTVNAYGNPSIPVELGASIFVKVNTILNDAVREFNLSTDNLSSTGSIPGASLAVWDGQRFVYTQSGSGSWWDTAKLLWKYGFTPIKIMRLVRPVVAKFLEMYEEPVFPFESLTQAAQDVGLLAVVAATGEQYIAENLITGDFIREIVQASTRVNYASNLRFIHGLEAMVCMAIEDAHGVAGGNWQIFDHMIKASNATIHLKQAVDRIDAPKSSGQITLHTNGIGSEEYIPANDFDEVILATPLQFSNVSFKDLDVDVDDIPYVQLHVTLLTSPHLISPAFFGRPSDQPAPKVILTTLSKDEQPERGPAGVGSPGFFSVSLLDPVVNPKTDGQEYLYKIFSQQAPTANFLSQLLGFETPDSEDDADLSEEDVSWIYRKLWNSYPYEYPRVTFEKIKLADGLWYTSGMDSFISTMETNALMGKNVAKLIVNGWKKDVKVVEDVAHSWTPKAMPITDEI